MSVIGLALNLAHIGITFNTRLGILSAVHIAMYRDAGACREMHRMLQGKGREGG